MGDFTTFKFQTSTSPTPINWRRFWDLFSSEQELTQAEKEEMTHLKLKLREMHSYLENEEKRRNERLRIAIQVRLSELRISDNRAHYIVHRDDYKRGTDKERDYIRMHRNFLYRIYDNRCGKCSNDQNGLDIDHLFFSKNEGGCFEMLHIDGFKVNNAVPLCESCNRSKSDRDYQTFFTPHELIRVLEKNIIITERLNQNLVHKFTRGVRNVDITNYQV